MQIRFNCPTDECVALIELEPFESAGSNIKCPRCHTKHPVHPDEALIIDHRIDVCPLCQCSELFVRKDFPQMLGVLIVIVAGVISLITLKSNFIISWGVLVAAVLIDLVLYLCVGMVTVCYACRAEYRHVEPNPNHNGFDLAQSEKY